MNALRNAEKREEKFNSLMGEGMSYKELNEKVQKNLLLFCAKVSDKLEGKESPETMEEFRKNQRGYFTNPIFLRTLAGIVTDIVTPVLPATFSDAMDWLAQTVYAPLGKTYEIDVQSNDIFLFEDDSWGASRSKPSNYLYAKTLTMNPTLRTAKATWKWYQLAGNDADLGRTFNAISAGMYSKITALWVNALVAASTNTMYTPTNMQFTFSNTNWVTAAKRVAMLNGTGVSNVMAFGDLLALSHVLPSSANGTNTSGRRSGDHAGRAVGAVRLSGRLHGRAAVPHQQRGRSRYAEHHHYRSGAQQHCLDDRRPQRQLQACVCLLRGRQPHHFGADPRRNGGHDNRHRGVHEHRCQARLCLQAGSDYADLITGVINQNENGVRSQALPRSGGAKKPLPMQTGERRTVQIRPSATAKNRP